MCSSAWNALSPHYQRTMWMNVYKTCFVTSTSPMNTLFSVPEMCIFFVSFLWFSWFTVNNHYSVPHLHALTFITHFALTIWRQYIRQIYVRLFPGWFQINKGIRGISVIQRSRDFLKLGENEIQPEGGHLENLSLFGALWLVAYSNTDTKTLQDNWLIDWPTVDAHCHFMPTHFKQFTVHLLGLLFCLFFLWL